MSDENQRKSMVELIDASRTKNGGVVSLNARLKKFELRYEMTSEELKNKCAEGKVKETAEIAKWLFLLEARDAVEAKKAYSR